VALSPGPIDGIPAIPNPLGIDSLGIALGQTIVDLVEGFQMVVALTAAASPFVRLRHAGMRERQQIKWFAYAATILIVGAVLSSPVPAVWEAWWVSPVGFILSLAGVVGLPIAVGIAILRYHLYDINLIINRTLVYVPLSAGLAGLFELNVVVLSRLFAGFAEHRHLTESHRLAELISALAIAIVFDPLKERMQRFVNRYLPGGEQESGTRAYSDKDTSTESWPDETTGQV
jgi:hypothetical protein